MYMIGIRLDLLRIYDSVVAEINFLDDFQRDLQQTCKYILALQGSRIVGEGDDLRRLGYSVNERI